MQDEVKSGGNPPKHVQYKNRFHKYNGEIRAENTKIVSCHYVSKTEHLRANFWDHFGEQKNHMMNLTVISKADFFWTGPTNCRDFFCFRESFANKKIF